MPNPDPSLHHQPDLLLPFFRHPTLTSDNQTVNTLFYTFHNMAPIITVISNKDFEVELIRRDWCLYGDCSTTWTWARWILFALLIIGFALIIISTIKVNRRRQIEGRAPITGTSWMTPPSYSQSQQQQPYVPQYTENANPDDAGYYDNQGNYHQNPFSKNPININPEPIHLNNLVPDQTGISKPDATYQSTGTPHDPNDGFTRDFQAYYNNSDNVGSSSTNPGDNLEFQRPVGPPPSAHLKR